MDVMADNGNRESVDYEALDLRDRGIIRHLVIALVAGLLAGMIGTGIHLAGWHTIESLYDPYAYFVLVTFVGRTAIGYGWALLSSALTTFGSLIPVIVGLGLTPHSDISELGGSAGALNLLVCLLIVFGVLGHVTLRHLGGWGDVAGGVICGILLVDIAERAAPWREARVAGFWPWGTLVVGAGVLALLWLIRPGPLRRLRVLAVALAIGVPYLFLVIEV